ncbi:MAG: NUDIX hydrolase, partial [Deltaproteobacteria bacterium]|nr:NUDIX hydrolase [Deltaproteobacteria bacterium]
AEEVLHGAFLPIQQILADAEHLPYTPDGVMILKRLLNEKNINI